MNTKEQKLENIENEDGFLKEMSGWTREIAEELAVRNDLGPLTEDHWLVIDYVREYYTKWGEGPPIVKIGKAIGFQSKHICEMFPCGVAKGAYRLAGLPRPFGCL
ncbi:TusE/DsrC/DsvC family sulfur relay protein [bacterium]|nr:TusE/DsrC/DsvC family sulfur relay protein [bacterium]